MIKKILLKVLIVGALFGGYIGFNIFRVYLNLPKLTSDIDLDESTIIYDSKGRLLDEVHGEEHRKVIKYSQIDTDIINAVVAIEDKNFWTHSGVDMKAVGRALKTNIQKGRIQSGASTITMQLIKNLYFDSSISWERKISEFFLARELENRLSKEDIMELYLNTIYFGNNTYGIETATETYFNKPALDVEPHEASMLAALIQNPSRYDPYNGDYTALKIRQRKVLNALYPENPELVNKLHEKPLKVTGPKTWKASLAPFVTDAVLLELESRYRKSREEIAKSGYKVIASIDKKVQDKAIETVKTYSRWRGSAQIALVSVDVDTHTLVATVGSTDYYKSPLNRSLQSIRQPGSAMKPFVYYTSLRYGFSPSSLIEDGPYCIRNYCPKNYGGEYSGIGSLYSHLVSSRNIPAVKVGKMIGIANVIKDMRNLGITSKLEVIDSFPLGSNDIRPVEMANAFAAFSNGGKFVKVSVLHQVKDKDNKILLDNRQRRGNPTLNTRAVKQLSNMLRGVVTGGTGTNAATRVASYGKTGTTERAADTWFVGYTKDISTAVWVGNDNYNKKLPPGATGGKYAAPIYRSFVNKYY